MQPRPGVRIRVTLTLVFAASCVVILASWSNEGARPSVGGDVLHQGGAYQLTGSGRSCSML